MSPTHAKSDDTSLFSPTKKLCMAACPGERSLQAETRREQIAIAIVFIGLLLRRRAEP